MTKFLLGLLLAASPAFADITPTADQILPPQAGNAGKVLGTNGTQSAWQSVGGGTGTVTSVGLTAPAFLSVSGSPVTSSGTLALTLNGFADLQIPFGSNAGGSFSGDSNFLFDSTNKTFLLGNASNSSQPGGATGVPFFLVANNASSANAFMYYEYINSNANGGGIAIRKARGTVGTRTNVLSGDGLGAITFNGYTASGYGGGTAAIAVTAEENYSGAVDGNRGSGLIVQTTPLGATTPNGVRRNTAKFFSNTTAQTQSMKLYEIGGTNGITMSVPASSNYSMTLPGSLPAGNGFWTIGSGGTGNFTQLSGDATTGAAQGSVVVTRLNGNAVASTAPSNNQVMLWTVGAGNWHPVTLTGDVSTTATDGTLQVVKIQGTPVSATAPTSGQHLVYNSTSTQWEPSSVGAAANTTLSNLGTTALNANLNMGTHSVTFFSGGGLLDSGSNGPILQGGVIDGTNHGNVTIDASALITGSTQAGDSGIIWYMGGNVEFRGQSANKNIDFRPGGGGSGGPGKIQERDLHIEHTDYTQPSLSSCGTSPSIVGNDTVGRITVGTSSSNTCTLTFLRTWTNAPICLVQDETTGIALTLTPSTSALVIAGSGIVDGDKITYHCEGYF